MSKQPLQEDELRRKVSKMCEGIGAGYHGEDGVDYIMQLIKAYSEQKALEARMDELESMELSMKQGGWHYAKLRRVYLQAQLTNNQGCRDE